MICYRDRVWCTSTCNPACPRALTAEVVAAAVRWWGGDDAPIDQGNLCRDACTLQPEPTDDRRRHPSRR